MTSMVFQKSAAAAAVTHARLSLPARLLPRRKRLRLRRRIPPWVGLALLVLIADAVMAVVAWGAVYLVLN